MISEHTSINFFIKTYQLIYEMYVFEQWCLKIIQQTCVLVQQIFLKDYRRIFISQVVSKPLIYCTGCPALRKIRYFKARPKAKTAAFEVTDFKNLKQIISPSQIMLLL